MNQPGIYLKVKDDPLTVRLNFEPSGRPEGEAGEYYLTFKANKCVVCGEEESYLKKYVVPHEYRKYFPGKEQLHQRLSLVDRELFNRGNARPPIARRPADVHQLPPGVQPPRLRPQEGAGGRVRRAHRYCGRRQGLSNILDLI